MHCVQGILKFLVNKISTCNEEDLVEQLQIYTDKVLQHNAWLQPRRQERRESNLGLPPGLIFIFVAHDLDQDFGALLAVAAPVDQVGELFLSLETAKVTAEADVEADEDARFAAAVDAQEGVESAPELEGGRGGVDHEPIQGQLDNLTVFEVFGHFAGLTKKIQRLKNKSSCFL